MATTVTTDISSTVDIIARKDDTFQLKLNITSSDGSAFNLTDAGVIFVHIGKDITNSIPAGTYLYGLQITTGGTAQTFLTGKFILKDDITGEH